MKETERKDKPTNVLTLAIYFLLIAMICVLATSSGSCDRPIRPWIIVTICLLAVHIGLVLLWRLVRGILPTGLKPYTKALKFFLHVVLQLGLLVWVVFGSIWIFGDFADCADGIFYLDFTGGFVVTLTTLLMYYVLAGLAAMLTVFWCIGRGLLTRSQYQEI